MAEAVTDHDLILLRISFHDLTIRTRLTRSTFVRQQVEHLVRSSFHLEGAPALRLRFMDEDGSPIDILSDRDLEEALFLYDDQPPSKSKCIRLWVDVPASSTSKGPVVSAPLSSYQQQQQQQHKWTHPTAENLLREISAAHQHVAERVVDWWLRKMPEAYFREIDAETRMSHLRAFIALDMAGQKQEILLYNKDRTNCTVIKPGNYVGLLSEVIHSLPKGRQLREANIYTAIDGDLVLDVFEFHDGGAKEHRKLFDLDEHASRVKDILNSWTQSQGQTASTDQLRAYLRCCDQPYVLNSSVTELRSHYQLVQEAYAKDNCVVRVEVIGADDVTEEPGGVFAMDSMSGTEVLSSRLMVVLKQEHDHDAFPRIVQHLSRSSVDILKATLNRVENFKGCHFVILTCYVRHLSGASLTPSSTLALELCEELRKLLFLDGSILEWMDQHPGTSLIDAERIVTMGRVVHCLLSDDRPLVYTQTHINQFMDQYKDLMQLLLQLWDLKLTPPSKSSISSRYTALQDMTSQIQCQIEKVVELEDCKIFFQTVLDLIHATLKSNMHLADRLSLTLRLDPVILKDKPAFRETQIELPYGLFFVFGRGFVGLHVRFRDIARGGMRLLMPSSAEEFTVMHGSMVQDVYQMAYNQQLKNKDIPESGAKALVLIEPGRTTAFNAARAFTDGLLDLTCSSQANNLLIADYFGEPELIYLGPDENVTTPMITWIYQRAVYRRHPLPSAFMSSKPGAGINHQEFGVGAEGLVIFLDVGLRYMGFDIRQEPFTVKLTGGPDGGNSGNLIRILIRTYGQHVKLVAIADSSGVAEDPQGLDQQELLRLVHATLPIIEFNRSKLSSRGHIISVTDSSGIGAKARNSMHFRVESDVFIIAGGRPQTINASNWMQFIVNQKPCSRLIVEGCHQFLDQEAQHQLAKRGVIIISDSSASKSGVISSSYEILASMLLSDAEFLSIKGAYVTEVLYRLRHLAKLEAVILFKEYHQQFSSSIVLERKTLPEISSLISKAIIRVKDAILQSGQLDVYALPLPTSSSSSKDPSLAADEKKEGGTFFIEPTTPVVVNDEHKQLQQLANKNGFTYNPVFHKLCRELLLEYIPPSLRTFAMAIMTAKPNEPASFQQDTLSRRLAATHISTTPSSSESEDNEDGILMMRRTHAKPLSRSSSEIACRLDAILPLVYRKRILATALSCRIIYNEGVQFLDATLGVDLQKEQRPQFKQGALSSTPPAFSMPMSFTREYASKIAEWAFRYLVEYERTAELVETIQKVDSLDPAVRKRIVMVLERGGTRIGVELDHQLQYHHHQEIK